MDVKVKTNKSAEPYREKRMCKKQKTLTKAKSQMNYFVLLQVF